MIYRPGAGRSKYLWNGGRRVPNYTALQPRHLQLVTRINYNRININYFTIFGIRTYKRTATSIALCVHFTEPVTWLPCCQETTSFVSRHSNPVASPLVLTLSLVCLWSNSPYHPVYFPKPYSLAYIQIVTLAPVFMVVRVIRGILWKTKNYGDVLDLRGMGEAERE